MGIPEALRIKFGTRRYVGEKAVADAPFSES